MDYAVQRGKAGVSQINLPVCNSHTHGKNTCYYISLCTAMNIISGACKIKGWHCACPTWRHDVSAEC